MTLLEHWHFATLANPPAPVTRGEVVLVDHPATGLATLVAIPDHDGRRGVVRLHDPARDVAIVTGGTTIGMTARLGALEVCSGPHSSNRITFVPAGTPLALHCWRDGSMMVALILPAGRLAALAPEGSDLPPPFALAEEAALAEHVQAIKRLIMRLRDTDCTAICAETARLAAALAEMPQTAAPAPSQRIALSPPKLRSLLAYIDAHLDQPLSLRDLADRANLSPYHFARVFKQATGRSPHDHVRWRRIVRSTALIARSELKIAEISASTGFASAAHFSQAFQQAAGVTPSHFRRVARQRLLHPKRLFAAQPD